jgi:hypothetical protein
MCHLIAYDYGCSCGAALIGSRLEGRLEGYSGLLPKCGRIGALFCPGDSRILYCVSAGLVDLEAQPIGLVDLEAQMWLSLPCLENSCIMCLIASHPDRLISRLNNGAYRLTRHALANVGGHEVDREAFMEAQGHNRHYKDMINVLKVSDASIPENVKQLLAVLSNNKKKI